MAKHNIYKLADLDGPEAQKKSIFRDLGDLKRFQILDDDLLLATYATSNVLSEIKGPNGEIIKLYGTDNRAQESRFQGKAHLVVAVGPTAFKYHNNGQPYEGETVKVGDWVVIHPSDGREVWLKDYTNPSVKEHVVCRKVHWSSILMKVDDPRLVY